MAVGTTRHVLTSSWVAINGAEANIAGIVKYGYADFIVQPTGAPSASESANVLSLKQGDDFNFIPGNGNSVYARRTPQWDSNYTEIQVGRV